MTALSDELKPCPFCGGAAALLPRTCDKNTPYNPADRAFPVARCGQCGAEAVGKDWGRPETAAEKWNTRALLAAQPAQETDRDWSEAQDWKGMDGAQAWHLIYRHADGWGDTGAMMNAWLAANAAQPAVQQSDHSADASKMVQQPAEDAPSDQIIELAGALEVRRILEAIKEVAKLRPANEKIAYDAAWQLCCEEIFYRATGCRWHMDEDATRFGRAAIKAQGGKQ